MQKIKLFKEQEKYGYCMLSKLNKALNLYISKVYIDPGISKFYNSKIDLLRKI